MKIGETQILKIRSIGSDLFADFYCTCLSKLFKNTSIAKIMKTKITLSGYNDSYFFDTVNACPTPRICECGKSYLVQWKRDGVEVKYTGKLKKIKS